MSVECDAISAQETKCARGASYVGSHDQVLDLLERARGSLLDFEYGKIEDDSNNQATQRYMALLGELTDLLEVNGRLKNHD